MVHAKEYSKEELREIIDKTKQKIKKHPVVIKMFKDYGVDLDELDLIPMAFADLDVSARTERGVIWFNYKLLEDGFGNDDHYMTHEVTHYLQQCSGTGPTKSSNDGNYLDNEFEQEGFQNQTEYISSTKGDEAAEEYIDKVLDHHKIDDDKEREDKKDDLLSLAKIAKHLVDLDRNLVNESIFELLKDLKINLKDNVNSNILSSVSIDLSKYHTYKEVNKPLNIFLVKGHNNPEFIEKNNSIVIYIKPEEFNDITQYFELTKNVPDDLIVKIREILIHELVHAIQYSYSSNIKTRSVGPYQKLYDFVQGVIKDKSLNYEVFISILDLLIQNNHNVKFLKVPENLFNTDPPGFYNTLLKVIGITYNDKYYNSQAEVEAYLKEFHDYLELFEDEFFEIMKNNPSNGIVYFIQDFFKKNLGIDASVLNDQNYKRFMRLAYDFYKTNEKSAKSNVKIRKSAILSLSKLTLSDKEHEFGPYIVELEDEKQAVIRRNDDKPVNPSFYEMQHMKDIAFGGDSEAIEIFPKHKDLIDGENQRHLWLMEDNELPNLNKSNYIKNRLRKLALISLAGLTDFFENLNVNEEVKQFILSLSDTEKQYYVSEVRKNPNITLEELKNIVKIPEEKISYTSKELNLSENLPDNVKKWALVNLRKIRNAHKKDDLFTDNHPYYVFWQFLVSHEFKDWYNAVNPNISSYSPEQAYRAVYDWHEAVALKGAGKEYMEGPENIVYGPNWKNPEYNGWTIRKVTTENDLLVEGNRMGHCVGEYCDDVRAGTSDIYSLRDPQNNPHVTIEANGGSYDFVQIEGKKNKEPVQKYKDILKEWFSTLKNPTYTTINENEDVSLPLMNIKNLYNEVENIFSKKDYGLDLNFSNFSVNFISNIIEDIGRILYLYETKNHNKTLDKETYNEYLSKTIELLTNNIIKSDEDYLKRYGHFSSPSISSLYPVMQHLDYLIDQQEENPYKNKYQTENLPIEINFVQNIINEVKNKLGLEDIEDYFRDPEYYLFGGSDSTIKKSKINYRKKTLLALASLEHLLNELKISEEIKQFILSLSDTEKQYYMAEIRKNPNLTLEELKNVVKIPEEKNKLFPYLQNEILFVMTVTNSLGQPEKLMKWISVNLRKYRIANPGTYESFGSEYSRFKNFVASNEFRDWYINVNPDISSFSPEQVKKASDDWHEAMAKEGEGKEYQEGLENIVYGPIWKNKDYNGWTIRKITTENDLKVEGFKMGHCVGSYCNDLLNKEADIYSLRDPQNKPHVTLDADYNSNNFVQIQGKENKNPIPKYKEMIKEWFSTLKNPTYTSLYIDDINFDNSNISDLYDEIQQLFTNNEYDVKLNLSDVFVGINSEIIKRISLRLIESKNNLYNNIDEINNISKLISEKIIEMDLLHLENTGLFNETSAESSLYDLFKLFDRFNNHGDIDKDYANMIVWLSKKVMGDIANEFNISADELERLSKSNKMNEIYLKYKPDIFNKLKQKYSNN